MRADRENITRLLKTARGQLDGILRMVDEDRYCIDISTQILAVQSILNKINREILAAHLHGCVKSALTEGDVDKKLDEVLTLFEKLQK